jgi:hypothetical protein
MEFHQIGPTAFCDATLVSVLQKKSDVDMSIVFILIARHVALDFELSPTPMRPLNTFQSIAIVLYHSTVACVSAWAILRIYGHFWAGGLVWRGIAFDNAHCDKLGMPDNSTYRAFSLAITCFVFHSLTGLDGDGAYPAASAITGENGVLYGSTQYSGSAPAACNDRGAVQGSTPSGRRCRAGILGKVVTPGNAPCLGNRPRTPISKDSRPRLLIRGDMPRGRARIFLTGARA